MANNVSFPSEMIFDKELTLEQLNLLESQYRRFITISGEIMDSNQYQLYLDKNKIPYFPKGTLIHGTGSSLESLRKISKSGILACEFFGGYEDGETFYCADFHRVSSDIAVSDYDKDFIPDSKTPFNRVNNKIGLVVNATSKLGGLLYYDILDSKFDNNVEVRNIINSSSIPRGFLGKNRGKGAAVLCGIPANAISGIVIGDKLVLDSNYIKEIQNLFPNAYLITRKGTVIKDRSNTINIDDYDIIAYEKARFEIINAEIDKENAKLNSEIIRKNDEFSRYMKAVIDVVPPVLQAKVLLKYGYQSVPNGLLEMLTDEEKAELRINDKSVKK